jgi:hypothetical protein
MIQKCGDGNHYRPHRRLRARAPALGSARWSACLEIIDWAAMERLHEKGLISDPVGRAKSVVLTDEGLEKAERLFRDMFETHP